MDKEAPYQTFQFIETGNSNPDMNQLLVLQEDGTLLSVNRDIHYITQVQDVKEVIGDEQACAVFDVASQQFYVDVDNQIEISHSDGNIYSNSFLIQAETSAPTEPMETETTTPDLKSKSPLQNEAEESNSSKAANNFTEITLTDAQYHLLEQKGWILLEFSARIFVLDTLGLHDITTDEKLIQKLKSELDGTTSHLVEPGQVKIENTPTPPVNTLKEEIPPHMDIQLINHNSEAESTDHNKFEYPEVQIKTPRLDFQRNEEIVSTIDSGQKCDSIKIKTKYTFSNIPDKIFLGKTVNGKKLYAKVTKSKHKDIANMKLEMCRKSFEKEKSVDSIDDSQFINIIQDYIREHPSKIQLNNVIAADTVVTQLMRMAHIKDTVMGNYIILTKTVIFITADGKEKTRRKPITVTGEVKSLDDTHGRFVHTPYLLHNMAAQDKSNTEAQLTENIVNKFMQEFVEFVHIHITETKMPRKPSAQSINVCNRKISLDVIRDAKKRHPNPVYACSACAAVFKSQCTLKDHMENNCSGAADPDDALTIDTDSEQTDTYYVLDIGNEKWYYCIQCEAKFLKLYNCKKHIESHTRPIKQDSDSDRAPESQLKEYKCKMCSCKYFHASSLSKHIVKRHIQVNSNKQP